MSPLVALFVLAVLAVAAPAHASPPVKHSGEIVADDPVRHTVTLDELGPWSGPGTGDVRRTVHVASGAPIDVIERTKGVASSGWPDGYVSAQIPASDLRVGDFVTLATVRRDGQLVAVSADVVRPASAGG
jgi:hypothetical protein